MEIRQSYDRLISTMGFPIPVRHHLYIESGPRPLLEPVLTYHQQRSCGIHSRVMFTYILKISISKLCLKFTYLNSQPHLPGSNELTHPGLVWHIFIMKRCSHFPSDTYSICITNYSITLLCYNNGEAGKTVTGQDDLTHFGLLTPYGNICQGQRWLR